MKNAVFWDVAQCRSRVNRRFGSTRRRIPEDGILRSHRRENLKSYKMSLMSRLTCNNFKKFFV
jgi:hypothetical protein